MRPMAPPVLEFFNGLGGFAEDGREYVTILDAGATTPAHTDVAAPCGTVLNRNGGLPSAASCWFI